MTASLQLEREDAREFVTAVGEALANAIEHSRSETVEVACWIDDVRDKIIATVADSGCGFPAVPRDPVFPPPHAERGRGLSIMRRYTDDFQIRTEPGKGTTVLLVRKLHRGRS